MSEKTTKTSEQLGAIRWEDDGSGIVTLMLDDPTASANTMNELYTTSMDTALERLGKHEGLRGVIVTSAKKSFFAGGDLAQLITITDETAAQMAAGGTHIKSQLRRLETLGKPVVAAINGSALGGGLEIALACHHRIALADPKIRIGLPEVTLGLLPGAGGIVRTVRLLGLVNALTKVLLQGPQLRPDKALEVGLIDELATDPEDLLAKARAWIDAHPEAAQPWDTKGYKVPGGTTTTPALAGLLPTFTSNLVKQLKGAHYPAPHHILCAAVEGLQVDVESAFAIEGRYFIDLCRSQSSTNLIQALWFDLNAINGGGSRPAGPPKYTARKVAVLGAGMMGAGIAQVCAKAGIDVVLKDVTLEAAEKGKAYTTTALDKRVAKGTMTEAARDQLLARIHPTADLADLAGCDVVIEAVFEDTALKHKVFGEVEPVVAPDALLASNTSTLPITGLAEGVSRRSDFVGMHFFSPVERMPLVELIVGAQTSPEALARAYDVVRQIGKTPIVVQDSRGFFTSRVFGTLVNEGAALLAEGMPAMSVERAALQAGFPAGPLTLFDEITMTLPLKIADEMAAAARAEGREVPEHPGMAVVRRMVELGRPGKSSGKGFFDWDGEKRVWSGLAETFGSRPDAVPMAEAKDRLLFAMAVETVRCLDEGVLTSVPDANIGSIMGIGFPPLYGGVLQFVDQYPGGVAGFVARADQLADQCGERFRPTDKLREIATRSTLREAVAAG